MFDSVLNTPLENLILSGQCIFSDNLFFAFVDFYLFYLFLIYLYLLVLLLNLWLTKNANSVNSDFVFDYKKIICKHCKSNLKKLSDFPFILCISFSQIWVESIITTLVIRCLWNSTVVYDEQKIIFTVKYLIFPTLNYYSSFTQNHYSEPWQTSEMTFFETVYHFREKLPADIL